MREIKKIIVHCSATSPKQDIGAEEITQWHKQRGFSDIGYHYVIKRDGTLQKGRDIGIAGAHARGHNFSSIGVCLVGGINEDGQPENNYTNKQMRKLQCLLSFLVTTFECTVIGHRDLPGVRKACPCFDVQAWYYGG